MTNALAALADTSTHSGPSPHRRFVFAVVVLGLLCVLCAPFFIDLVDHDAPVARDGVVDYASWARSTSILRGRPLAR